jgi:hypothetical protein
MSRFSLAALMFLGTAVFAGGCAADTDDQGDVESGEDALTHRARDAWFYDGPLPALEKPEVTISLKGHTARVSGLLPAGTQAPNLPHLKSKVEGTRTRVDIVYPIATGAEGGYNAAPGDYVFESARPWRPDGMTTSSHGTSFVTWGGFPFIAYNGGIAMHGPITTQSSAAGVDVFYLRRGTVSHGCNRMNGEHVTEVAQLVGINMRKVWVADQIYEDPSTNKAKVRVVKDAYDQYDGKPIDVDYATDVGVTRPQGSVMFGSWIASETADGSDLPLSMKWEGGVAGKPYVFKEHVLPNMVCSFPEALLQTANAAKNRKEGAMRTWAKANGGVVPKGICAKKACVIEKLRTSTDASSCFR